MQERIEAQEEVLPPSRGPRGGTTTVTKSGMVKKNLWIPHETAEVLRAKAFDERRSEADIIREALEILLDEWHEEKR